MTPVKQLAVAAVGSDVSTFPFICKEAQNKCCCHVDACMGLHISDQWYLGLPVEARILPGFQTDLWQWVRYSQILLVLKPGLTFFQGKGSSRASYHSNQQDHHDY